MDFRQDQYSWPVNPTFMLVKLSGHTVLLGRHCGGSFPPRHWFPLEPEKPRRTPVRGFFFGRRLRPGAPQAHSWPLAVGDLDFDLHQQVFGPQLITYKAVGSTLGASS